jgi:hypothetical protein
MARDQAAGGRKVPNPEKQESMNPSWLASFASAERSAHTAALAPPPPQPDELQVLTTLAEVCNATESAIATGQRLVSIFTPDLEPPVYNNPAVIEAVKRFVLGHSYAKVRVLIRDHNRHTGSQSRFMSMARRLSSYLELRILIPRFHYMTESFCIADDRALVYRMRADRWDGIASLNNPSVARQYLEEFDVAWQASYDEHHKRIAHM